MALRALPMRFVAMKSGLLTEFGVVAPLSPDKLRRELAICQDPQDLRSPPTVRPLIDDQLTALDQLETRLATYADQIAAQAARC